MALSYKLEVKDQNFIPKLLASLANISSKAVVLFKAYLSHPRWKIDRNEKVPFLPFLQWRASPSFDRKTQIPDQSNPHSSIPRGNIRESTRKRKVNYGTSRARVGTTNPMSHFDIGIIKHGGSFSGVAFLDLLKENSCDGKWMQL